MLPEDLRKANHTDTKLVDAADGRRKFASEAERVGFLFERYSELVAAQGKLELRSEGAGGRKKRATRRAQSRT